jgi:chorismate synthase
MGSNTFGKYFSITTFGESHGPYIGVVIDGCPANLLINPEMIQNELNLRRPGQNAFTSPRNEPDTVEIISGLFENRSTGAPVTLLIKNTNQNKAAYEPIKHILRPGHANYTYMEKYQIYDPYGGGRASARETAARVAAGSIAKQYIAHFNIEVLAYLHQVDTIIHPDLCGSIKDLMPQRNNSPVFTIDENTQSKMQAHIEQVKKDQDSCGGIVRLITSPLPTGLGDPIYEKLEALLGSAMLSIPATKGVEFGEGFNAVHMKGSEHNDLFSANNDTIKLTSNHAGGTLGGISNGCPIDLKVVFKPTASIQKPQKSMTFSKERATLDLGEKARHDPCVAIRGVIVVEAMAALVLADRLLANKLASI